MIRIVQMFSASSYLKKMSGSEKQLQQKHACFLVYRFYTYLHLGINVFIIFSYYDQCLHNNRKTKTKDKLGVPSLSAKIKMIDIL